MKIVVILSTVLLFCSNGFAQKKQAAETAIGDEHLFITLPGDYMLEAQPGPDFTVYYFHPKDSLQQGAFTGGLYFGQAPSRFGAGAGCSTEFVKSALLNVSREWTVYNCREEYDAQTIVELGQQRVHVFGHAKSRADLDRLLRVCATMRQVVAAAPAAAVKRGKHR